jgi:L-aminopeptidase/D-esterase-like protein
MALGVRGVLVGCWTAPDGDTGTTVVLPPPGTIGGAALRGAAPGSRETDALSPTGAVEACHAIVLTGGSAFGLAAADGVMAWCEAHGLGYELPTVTVPIVGAAVCFDIRRRGQRRPGRSAGWAACEAAVEDDPPQGSVGVGAGCTAGKLAGREWATKGGQGWSVMRSGELTVGALMAVNPVGEVFDEDGTLLAGTRAPQDAPRYPHATMEQIRVWGEARAAADPEGDGVAPVVPSRAGDHPGGERAPSPVVVPMANTVIGCVVTDAQLTKPAICRAADLAHTGIARAVVPAHTSADGDLLFLLATGQGPPAAVDQVADLAARAVAEAIRSAVVHATGIPGAPADPRARRRATPPS